MSKFTRTPKRDTPNIDEFLNMEKKEAVPVKQQKQAVQVFNLRLPASLWEQLHVVSGKTGITMHSLCLNMIHHGLKEYEK